MISRFLEFELDETLFELRSGGRIVPTQTRVFAMIAYLLHARSRVVGKDELMKALWKDSVVSDTAVSQVIMLARKALGDEAEQQRVIKTVRGRGFRFVAAVEEQRAPARMQTAQLEPRDPDLSTAEASAHTLARALIDLAGPHAEPLARPADHAPAAARAALTANRPLLGRSSELRELGVRLARAAAGQGGLVVIGGDPGIGKTSLVEAFAAEARAAGHELLFGHAWEEGGAPPFWPWLQVLRQLLETHGPARLRQSLGCAAAGLAALIPELASSDPPPTAADEEPAERARFRHFDAITQLLTRCALPEQVRVVLLEDLHAVDESSLSLLRFALPALRRTRLLVVATQRTHAGDAANPIADLLQQPGVTHVHLAGLQAPEVDQLLAHELARQPPPQLRAALRELSAGNPLLLRELCRQLSTSDPHTLRDLSAHATRALPERVACALRAQLSELPERTREALFTASALGRDFALPLLAALQDCTELALLDVLEPALRLGVICSGRSPASLSFSHALTCRAVYTGQSAAARAVLHHAIARWLANSAGRFGSLHEIAHHYFLAAADGCRAEAIDYAERAALEAERVQAHESAAVLHDRALHLAELEGVAPTRLHELLCNAGNAWYRAGELERCGALLERAAQLALAHGDAEAFAWAVIFEASTLRGTILYDPCRQAKLRQALALLPEEDSPVRACALVGSALDLRSPATADERDRITREAVAMARRLGDADTLQWALNARHCALWGARDPRLLLEDADELFELARRNKNYELMLDAELWRMADYCELGELDRMLRERRTYLALVEQYGSPWHRYMALSSVAMDVGESVSLTAARELSEQVLSFGLRVREPLARAFHDVRMLFLEYHLDAKQVAQPYAPHYAPHDYRCFWALPQALAGATEAARGELRQLLRADDSAQLADALRLPSLAVMSLVAIELRDMQLARELYARMLPWAERHMHLQAWVYLGQVALYLGMLARMLGDRDAAERHLQHALQQPAHVRIYRHYAQYEYAALLLARDRHCEQAVALLRAAADGAASLGMLRLQRASEGLLAELD